MQTTTLANTKEVQKCYRLFREGNIKELLSLLTDDVQWNVPGTREIPWAGKREGKAAVQEFFKIVDEKQEMIRMEPQEFIEQGNRVVALGEWESKIKKTGKKASGHWAMAFTFKNGKISRFREYSDTQNLVEAFRTVTGKTSHN